MTAEISQLKPTIRFSNYEEVAVALRAIRRQFEPTGVGADFTPHRLVTEHLPGDHLARYTLLDVLDTAVEGYGPAMPFSFVGEDRDDIELALSTTPEDDVDYQMAQYMLAEIKPDAEVPVPVLPQASAQYIAA